MNPLDKHKALTAVRARAYGELFGCTPSTVFPPHSLFKKPDDRFPIDILVYTLETRSDDIDVAVTNGVSDQRMADPGHPYEWKRRELSDGVLGVLGVGAGRERHESYPLVQIAPEVRRRLARSLAHLVATQTSHRLAPAANA